MSDTRREIFTRELVREQDRQREAGQRIAVWLHALRALDIEDAHGYAAAVEFSRENHP